MQLKIGKITYTIDEKDIFLDNGACVMLYTRKFKPKLSKIAIKQITPFKQIIKNENGFCWFKLLNMEQTK